MNIEKISALTRTTARLVLLLSKTANQRKKQTQLLNPRKEIRSQDIGWEPHVNLEISGYDRKTAGDTTQM
jgi:hypothetical protein